MTKKFLLASLMVLTAAVAQAAPQKSTGVSEKTATKKSALAAPAGAGASNTSFGLTAGLSMGDWKGPLEMELFTLQRVAMTGGVFMSAGNDRVQVQPELLFVPQGVSLGSVVYAFNYLQLPVHLKFLLGSPTAGNRIRLMVGPSLGLLLSAKINEEGADSEDIKDDCNTVDLGISSAIGVENGRFSLDVRLVKGLSTVGKEDTSELSVVRNQSVNVLLGYKFK